MSHNFDSSCHSCGQATNRLSCSEGGKVIHPLAAGVFDVEFTRREMVTKQANEQWGDPTLTRRARHALAVNGGMTCWHHPLGYRYRYRVSGIEGVDTIEYRVSTEWRYRSNPSNYFLYLKLLSSFSVNIFAFLVSRPNYFEGVFILTWFLKFWQAMATDVRFSTNWVYYRFPISISLTFLVSLQPFMS